MNATNFASENPIIVYVGTPVVFLLCYLANWWSTIEPEVHASIQEQF